MDSSSACDTAHQSTTLPILGSAAAFLNYTAQRFCIQKGSRLYEIRREGGPATSKRDKMHNHSTTMLHRNSTPQCSSATFNYADDDQLERGNCAALTRLVAWLTSMSAPLKLHIITALKDKWAKELVMTHNATACPLQCAKPIFFRSNVARMTIRVSTSNLFKRATG